MDRAEQDGAELVDPSGEVQGDFGTVVREVALPLGYRMIASGDPSPVFGPEAVLVLELRGDGSVTWRDDA